MSEFRRLARHKGTVAEDQAAAYLLEKGYTLVGRRIKTKRGELDIIALDGEMLVLVEVKAAHFGEPEWNLTEAKQVKLRLAAEDYLIQIDQPTRQMRFDLIAVVGDEIRHVPEAF